MKKNIVINIIGSLIIIGFLGKIYFEKNSYQEMAVYINDEYSTEFPKKGEALFSKAICDNDVKVLWDNQTWQLRINNLSKKTKCNLYFKSYIGKTLYDYSYTGDEQVFTVSVSGTYKIELWGASGGNIDKYLGGKGGYTAGKINLEKDNKLYIYVGGAGSDSDYSGSYNGGGIIFDGQIAYGRNGGGATDIRLVNGSWDNFNSLKSRIMVAAGGGGANFRNVDVSYGEWYGAGNGGSGGGLIGSNGESPSDTHTDPTTGKAYGWNYGTGGTQISAGTQMHNDTTLEYGEDYTGKFGSALQNKNQSGGGSGYYGGGSVGHGGAGGGSSFISGHNGCDAIKEESTEDNIIHTGQSIHYSGLYFTDTLMIDGNGYQWTNQKEGYTGMPSSSDKNIITGNSGNGYARITLISIDE